MGGNGIGFYGPLIDLTAAASHIGDFVQLIAFVHQFHPPQKLRASNGRELLKSTLRVGDDTQPYFDVSLWQKHLDSNISAGDVILLQNVKVTKFQDLIAATTVQHSSVTVLVQGSELLSSNGIDETKKRAQIGIAMKKKLKIVVAWAKLSQFTLLRYLDTMREYNKRPRLLHANGMPYQKWLGNEESELRVCSSISEVFHHKESCLVSFFGKIGEICLPVNTKEPKTTLSMKDWIFVSKSFLGQTNKILAMDFIHKGCKNCGYPMEEVKNSSTRNERTLPLYCGNSANQIHSVGWIYRPFLIHVWDQSANIPVLVKNLAAQQLLANIPAESVFQSLEAFNSPPIVKRIEAAASDSITFSDGEYSQQHTSSITECKRNEVTTAQDLYLEDSNGSRRVKQVEDNKSSNLMNFSKIFLILVRTLLTKDQNSAFKFQVFVNSDASKGTSVFELVSFKILEEA